MVIGLQALIARALDEFRGGALIKARIAACRYNLGDIVGAEKLLRKAARRAVVGGLDEWVKNLKPREK